MKKIVFSARINKELLEKARDLVYWNPDLTLTQFIEQALEEHIKLYKPSRKRTGPLKLGTRIAHPGILTKSE